MQEEDYNNDHFIINISNNKTININKIEFPECISNDENQILLLGEGNFTFSCSLACLRQSWRNLFSTSYNDIIPSFEQAQMDTIRTIIKNYSNNNTIPALHYISEISKYILPDYPWANNIDATNIPINYPLSIIWFQCPWVTKWKRTPDLIKSFFQHVGEKQVQGDLIILGIISIQPYCESYALDYLINGTEYYDFIGGNNIFIKQLLERGYRHQGIRDIHQYIYDTHLSLIFRHK